MFIKYLKKSALLNNAFLLSLLLLSTTVSAFTPQPGYYGNVSGGFTAGSGLVSAALGYRFNPLRVEAEYMNIPNFLGFDNSNLNALFANVLYDFRLESDTALKPFVGFGVGIISSDYNRSHFVSKTNYSAIPKAIFGVNYFVNEQLSITPQLDMLVAIPAAKLGLTYRF